MDRSETSKANIEAPFAFACPICRTPLQPYASGARRCPADGSTYVQVDGIWLFLTEDRAAYYERFIREYETVRAGEGRGNADPAYYRALPHADLSGAFDADWRIRARSFNTLVGRVVRPLEIAHGRPLKILDLGAGNGWLSNQLAGRGHTLAAVDLSLDRQDGLGAHTHYGTGFVPLQADFDHLPLTDRQLDLVVFNASFHYAIDYERTLLEGLRVLAADGRLVILDTPVYRNAESGQQMVRERQAHFQRVFGFPSDAIPSENFLTFNRLGALEKLGVEWETIQPFYGIRWSLRPWLARFLRRREPARFLVIVGRLAA